MNKTVKEIEDLKRRISYIEFQDSLSYDDEEAISELKRRIEELKRQIKGLKGVAVRVTYKDTAHFGDSGWYLTDDKTLCCSDEPVLFETKEEAEAQLAKADIDPEMYDVEFIETTL